MPTCWIKAPKASGPAMLITGCPDKLGWAAIEISSASPTRARKGKALEEKIGADVKTASTRKKGQISGDSQATI